MKLIKSAHNVYNNQYHNHIVPRKVFQKEAKSYLKTKLLDIRKYYPDWEYLEIGIDVDHDHLYMLIPPKYAVSKAVEIIKSNTVVKY